AKASNGCALNRTMSASLPISIEPSRPSRPSSRAGLSVIISSACTSVAPPYLTILAASRLRWRISSSLSLLMQTRAPASIRSAARGRAGPTRRLRRLIDLPLLPVRRALLEGALDRRLDPHPRVGEPAPHPGDILAQGELDPLGRVAEDQLAPRPAVAELDHGV